jgi:hypothetical protein
MFFSGGGVNGLFVFCFVCFDDVKMRPRQTAGNKMRRLNAGFATA